MMFLSIQPGIVWLFVIQMGLLFILASQLTLRFRILLPFVRGEVEVIPGIFLIMSGYILYNLNLM